MASRYVVFAAAGLWLGLVVTSFVVFEEMAPSGDGFARGMNRTVALLGWQAGAMAAAVVALVFALHQKPPRGLGVAIAGFAPITLMILELILVLALVVWAATRDPSERIERFYFPNGAAAQDVS